LKKPILIEDVVEDKPKHQTKEKDTNAKISKEKKVNDRVGTTRSLLLLFLTFQVN
jgi:hypothetical protein